MISFRLAEKEDFKAIIALPQNAEEAYYMFPRGTWPLQAEELYLASLERKLPVLMERDGRIAGYCSMYNVTEGEVAWLGNVIVSPDARGSGVSAELLGYMMEQGKAQF